MTLIRNIEDSVSKYCYAEDGFAAAYPGILLLGQLKIEDAVTGFTTNSIRISEANIPELETAVKMIQSYFISGSKVFDEYEVTPQPTHPPFVNVVVKKTAKRIIFALKKQKPQSNQEQVDEQGDNNGKDDDDDDYLVHEQGRYIYVEIIKLHNIVDLSFLVNAIQNVMLLISLPTTVEEHSCFALLTVLADGKTEKLQIENWNDRTDIELADQCKFVADKLNLHVADERHILRFFASHRNMVKCFVYFADFTEFVA